MLPSVRSGRLRHRVTVDVSSTATTGDSFGERAPQWSTTLTGSVHRYASIGSPFQSVSGAETMVADQPIAEATHLIEFRAVSGLSAKMHRIRFGSRVFDINYVDDVENIGVKQRVWVKEKVT